MAGEVTMGEDAARALQEAENFCWRMNVAIVAPEHLLAGCLKVLNTMGVTDLPTDDGIESALLMAQGMSDEKLNQNVMFGSAARDAVNFTARLVREAGGGEIDARTLAYGIIQSDEVGPMLYSALGTTKAELLAAITTDQSEPRP
jgi:hypothetical protein